MSKSLFVLNAGSSSIKFQLFDIVGDKAQRRLKGQLGGIGTQPRLKVTDVQGRLVQDRQLDDRSPDVGKATRHVLDFLSDEIAGDGLLAIGHRVVHGGHLFSGPAMVNEDSLDKIESLVPLAPLHQPSSIAAIRAIRAIRADLPQVACFDTVFHRGHEPLIDRLALPAELDVAGVRRYGFHGLSYAFIADQLRNLDPTLADGRVVVAHLGNGASLCAIRNGRSVETTMGFTALDGVPMGTRPGRLDAGVVLYLMQQGWDAKRIERMLYHECGLLALSGRTNDVRELEQSEDPQASFALDYFCHRIAQETALLATTMGGLDGMIFTAGIGEHSDRVRHDVARRLAWLGMKLDRGANEAHARVISTGHSRIKAMVIPTDEEAMIARLTLETLHGPLP
jgi:acetate kinase